jgi:hypothetical protein
MNKSLSALALAVFLAGVPAVHADVLVVDRVQAATLEVPIRGMTMDRVQSRFGAPVSVTGPVGNPPITRWDYPGFVVVFEHRHVIHSVQRHDRAPRPAS